MAVGRITKESVDAVDIPALGRRTYLWDTNLKGFGLMVTDKGARSYLVQYRIGGRGNPTRRVTIGKHGSPWTPATARTRAAEILEDVRRQDDPFDKHKSVLDAKRQEKQKREAEAKRDAVLSFSSVASEYMERDAKKRLKSWPEVARIIDKELLPVFGAKLLTAITAAEIIETLERIGDRSVGISRHSHAALSAIFKYASKRHVGLFPKSMSPMADVPAPPPSQERKHYLDDTEIVLLWNATFELGWPFGEIYRLLMLTGQRRLEVGQVAWPEIDLSSKRWLIPEGRTKNKREHLVPLSDCALEVFTGLPKIASKKQLLFTTTGETPVSGYSRAKKRIDEIIAVKSKKDGVIVRPWIVHDIRRTVATKMQYLGVKVEVTEEILNHKTGSRSSIARRYQVYEYEHEKRAALETWECHLLALVAGQSADNVTKLGITCRP